LLPHAVQSVDGSAEFSLGFDSKLRQAEGLCSIPAISQPSRQPFPSSVGHCNAVVPHLAGFDADGKIPLRRQGIPPAKGRD
jgi:hypothetical protein